MASKTFEESNGDFDPVENLIKLFDETDDTALKVEICSILLQYLYPVA